MPTLRGKWEIVFSGRHMDDVPKKTHDPSPASGNSGSGQSLLPHQVRRQRLTVKKATKKKDKRSQILCRYTNCRNPSCKFWHLPVCQNYGSESGCTYGDKCPIPTC